MPTIGAGRKQSNDHAAPPSFAGGWRLGLDLVRSTDQGDLSKVSASHPRFSVASSSASLSRRTHRLRRPRLCWLAVLSGLGWVFFSGRRMSCPLWIRIEESLPAGRLERCYPSSVPASESGSIVPRRQGWDPVCRERPYHPSLRAARVGAPWWLRPAAGGAS